MLSQQSFRLFFPTFFRVSAFWLELGHQGGTGGQLWLGLRNASVLTNKPALFLTLFAFVALLLFFRGLYG